MTDASPDWAELRRLAEAAMPGPWAADAVPTDGSFGGGPDTSHGFDTYAVFCERGEIMDAGNSDLAEIIEEHDENGRHAWDETARRNMEFVAAANPTAILALLDRAEKAEAEANALREATRPFAAIADDYDDAEDDSLDIMLDFPEHAGKLLLSMFRRARALTGGDHG